MNRKLSALAIAVLCLGLLGSARAGQPSSEEGCGCDEDCRSTSWCLGAATRYGVLGLDGATVVFGSAATTIEGDAGLGPNNGGSVIKATVTGKLFRDPTASTAQHSDLNVQGGTFVANLLGAAQDARNASTTFGGLVPTQVFGDIRGSTTFVGNGGLNVISVGSVRVVGATFTFVGGPSDRFLFNVAGEFVFNGGTMTMTGGATAENVLWNFPTGGDGVSIFKPVMVAVGTFLAPWRDVTLDKGTLYGAILAGGKIVVHSGAQLLCPVGRTGGCGCKK